MKLALSDAFVHNAPLDSMPEPFLFDLNWSALALIDAVTGIRRPPHRFESALPANDAAAHRPRRRKGFLAMPPLPSRFRIGG